MSCPCRQFHSYLGACRFALSGWWVTQVKSTICRCFALWSQICAAFQPILNLIWLSFHGIHVFQPQWSSSALSGRLVNVLLEFLPHTCQGGSSISWIFAAHRILIGTASLFSIHEIVSVQYTGAFMLQANSWFKKYRVATVGMALRRHIIPWAVFTLGMVVTIWIITCRMSALGEINDDMLDDDQYARLPFQHRSMY